LKRMKPTDRTFHDDEPPEIVCCVCGDDESLECDPIIFCDACDMAVHQTCYGLKKIPKGQWICERCEAMKKLRNESIDKRNIVPEIRCCVCPNINGAMKPTHQKGKWCHIICGLYIPELYFKQPATFSHITGFKNITRDRRELRCAICMKGKSRKSIDTKNNACVQCQVPQCYKAFHASCSREAILDMYHDPNEKFKIYCEKHRTNMKRYKRISIHGNPQSSSLQSHFKYTPPQTMHSTLSSSILSSLSLSASSKELKSSSLSNRLTSSSSSSSTNIEALENNNQMDVINDDNTVWCFCRKPYRGRFMIACDFCDEWYHGDCVNVTPEDADLIGDYKCDVCKSME